MNSGLTLAAVAVLVAITFAVVASLRLETPWLQPWSILRAVVQLGLLSLVLSGVIGDRRWVAAFLAVMVTAATFTVVQRIRLPPKRWAGIAFVVVVSAAVPLVVLFGTGALETQPRYLLAVGGIVIGACMTVTTLMLRTLSKLVVSARDEIEGWLALGATPRRATLFVVREAASTALVPSTDQARTTGIVTLPGAFVGAIFAGASVLAAAQFQLLVLASIGAAGAVAVALTGWLYGSPKVLAPLHEADRVGRMPRSRKSKIL